MKAPAHSAISHVKIRCFRVVQLGTPKRHMEMKRTRTIRKNEEKAVMRVWRRFGIDSAPIARATTAAATKALLVLDFTISNQGPRTKALYPSQPGPQAPEIARAAGRPLTPDMRTDRRPDLECSALVKPRGHVL